MLKRHDSGCNPYSSTLALQRQRCGVQTQNPRRIETAIKKLSLSRRHPIAVQGDSSTKLLTPYMWQPRNMPDDAGYEWVSMQLLKQSKAGSLNSIA